MSQDQNKCCRCCKLMDSAAFDNGLKTCRECMIKRKAYKDKNKGHLKESGKDCCNNNKENKAKYYQDYKEQIKAYNAGKLKCDWCGSVVGRTSIAKHKTSTKCKKHNLETNTANIE